MNDIEANRTEAATAVVELKGVSKFYGKDEETVVKALDKVNLTIERGSIVAIMGPSGSGKSTLINMIGSLDVPSTGEVIIDGVNLENKNLAELTHYRAETVGFIFQSFNLLPNLSVIENVELPMEFAPDRKEVKRERAQKLLKSVEMYSRRQYFPPKLSGGEKQRIAIARALANNPSIILADEPTGNLDTRTGMKVMLLLKEVARSRQKTLIVVTHDQNIARMTDQIVEIQDGRIAKIRKIEDERKSKIIYNRITKKLSISRSIAEKFMDAGYGTADEIADLNDLELKSVMKGLNRQQKEHVLRRIEIHRELREQRLAEGCEEPEEEEKELPVCGHCDREIPMEGAIFCPFCSGAV